MSRLEISTLCDLLHVYISVDEDHNELYGLLIEWPLK